MPPKAKLTREQKAAREEAARKAREAALKYLDENECGPEVGTGSVASARDNTLELRRARKAKEAADKAASLRAKLAAQQAKVATDLAAAGVSLGGGGAGALMGAVTDERETESGLPRGWYEVYDPATKGNYYWNSLTTEATWTRPEGSKPAKEAAKSQEPSAQRDESAAEPKEADAGELPPGWEPALDPSSGDFYFFNAGTGETSWTRPTASNNGAPQSGGAVSDGAAGATSGGADTQQTASVAPTSALQGVAGGGSGAPAPTSGMGAAGGSLTAGGGVRMRLGAPRGGYRGRGRGGFARRGARRGGRGRGGGHVIRGGFKADVDPLDPTGARQGEGKWSDGLESRERQRAAGASAPPASAAPRSGPYPSPGDVLRMNKAREGAPGSSHGDGPDAAPAGPERKE